MKVRKIYFSKKGVCSIICHHCAKTNRIDTNSVSLNKPIEIKFTCRKNFLYSWSKKNIIEKL
jgi:hypothetical protein